MNRTKWPKCVIITQRSVQFTQLSIRVGVGSIGRIASSLGWSLDPTIYELEKKENKSPPSCWKETAIKEAYIIQWRNLMFILCWVFRSGPPPVFTTLDNLVLLLLVAELPPRVQATLPVLHIVRCNPIPIAVIIIQNKENGVWKVLWLARMENHQVESTGNKRTNATFKYRNDLLKPNMATTWKTLDVSFFFLSFFSSLL